MTAGTANAAGKPKRADIQGLRAIAIFGVLLFHLAPKRFLNGFLGVDTFFVLSGYLMSTILSKVPSLNCSAVSSFYIRRFKRIVPLYACMLFSLMIITPLIFLPSDITHFVTDMEWALPFAENMQNVLKRYDYWAEVFSSPVLLHAWSLGVEIQYYLIVPLVMALLRCSTSRIVRLLLIAVMFAASFLIHLLSPKVVAFGLLFARVWQFLAGSAVFELEQALDEPWSTPEYESVQMESIDQEKLLDEDKEDDSLSDFDLEDALSKKPTRSGGMANYSFTPLLVLISYPLSAYLIWTLTWSWWGATLSRFLATGATSLLLLIGKYRQNWILSNFFMTYIGDLSYIVYLAHWPVIVLYKYHNDVTDLSVPDMSFCLLATLLISVVLHHSLEKFFITSSVKVSVIFVGIIYAIIIVGLLSGGAQKLSDYAHRLDDLPDIFTTAPPALLQNLTMAASPAKKTRKPLKFDRKEAISWNLAQSKAVYFKLPTGCVKDTEAEGWTKFYEEPSLRCLSTGNGTAKVLVIGNSYGYRAFFTLHRLFAGRYAKMRMFTRSVRTYLTLDPEKTQFAELEKLVVEKFQPDIVFVIEEDYWRLLMSPIVGDIHDDPVTRFLHQQVEFLTNHSGTVVVEQQYLKTARKEGAASIILKRLQQGRSDFDDLMMTRKDYETTYANEIARTATLRSIDNVIIHDPERALCPGDECYFFNRDNLHSYYGDIGCHLTHEGLRMLEPRYTEIIEDFLTRHAGKRTGEEIQIRR